MAKDELRRLGYGEREYCRRTVQRLARAGAVDFTLDEHDYFDPWKATRVVAVWFDLMLQESNGDLALASRSYHRGSPLAHRGEGEAYLANVKRLRRLYIRDEGASLAWHFLFNLARTEEFARQPRDRGPSRTPTQHETRTPSLVVSHRLLGENIRRTRAVTGAAIS